MSTAPRSGSASERAYNWVRERIFDGTYPAGRLLSEGEVSDALEISRTPVREAFLQLAGQDMLELYPKRGALVVPVTAAELMDVMGARALIEPWAARTLAHRLDRGMTVPALRELIAGTEAALREHDDHRFQELDRAFHERIVVAAGNGLLAQFYVSLRDRQRRAVQMAYAVAESRGTEIAAEHDAIANALDAADGELAGGLLAEHLAQTAALLGLAPIQGRAG